MALPLGMKEATSFASNACRARGFSHACEHAGLLKLSLRASYAITDSLCPKSFADKRQCHSCQEPFPRKRFLTPLHFAFCIFPSDTNRLAEAEPLMRRALAIFVASLGQDHPHSQTVAGELPVVAGGNAKCKIENRKCKMIRRRMGPLSRPSDPFRKVPYGSRPCNRTRMNARDNGPKLPRPQISRHSTN